MNDTTVYEGTVVSRLTGFARDKGLDPYAIAARAGMTREDVDDRTRMHSIVRVCRFYGALAEALDDPAVGLHIAEHATMREYGLIGLLFEQSPTIGEALENAARTASSFLAAASLHLEHEARTVRLVSAFEFEHPGLDYVRQDVLGPFFKHIRGLVGSDFKPVAVRLRQIVRDRAPFDAFFGIPVQMGAMQDELVLPNEILAIRMPGHDPLVLHHLQESAKVHLARRRAAAHRTSRLVHLEGCVVDLETGTVTRPIGPRPARGRRPAEEPPAGATEVLHLTTRERDLLDYFVRRKNEVVSHDDLERDIWQIGRTVVSHAPAVAIRRLRAKIEPPGSKPVNLLTVFGEGWKLVVTE